MTSLVIYYQERNFHATEFQRLAAARSFACLPLLPDCDLSLVKQNCFDAHPGDEDAAVASSATGFRDLLNPPVSVLQQRKGRPSTLLDSSYGCGLIIALDPAPMCCVINLSLTP